MPQQPPQNSIPPPELWVDQFGDLLFAAARKRLRDRSTCEELVQETLLAALKSMDSFRGDCEFSSWLVGILKHKILDHLRQTYRKRSESLSDDAVADDMFTTAGKWKRMPHRWRINPEDSAVESELEQMLAQCMDGLPELQRNAFVLSVMEEMGSDETCKALSVSATNLYVLLHRARLRLRDCLDKKGLGTMRT